MGYPIEPKHIDATEHFWDAFDKNEKEQSAHWIVLCCQKQGSWHPFSEADLGDDFPFNGLDDEEHITVADNTVTVHHKFIAKCFLSSPAVEAQE